VVADEAAALGRIRGNAHGPVLQGKAPNTVINQKAANDLANGSLPGITKNLNTGLPDVAPRIGVPREMPTSLNPSATAKDFANRIFGGTSTPVNAKPIPNCNGCWSATNADGVSVTYRPASTASGRTADTTASVNINFKPTGNVINGGEVVKLKFPQKAGQ
jgi:filamentous hemagglutinin